MTNYEKIQEAEKVNPYAIAEVEEIATNKKLSVFIDSFGKIALWNTENSTFNKHVSIDEFNKEFLFIKET